jgi:hypothetical protein
MECYHLLQPIKLEKLLPAFSSPPTLVVVIINNVVDDRI